MAFKNKNNKWLGSSRHYPVALPDTGKMEEVTHLIIIPENCWRLSIQLSAKCQPKNDKGAVICTGAQLYKY